MADFLFEIGLEEVPARMITGAEMELARRVLAVLCRELLIDARDFPDLGEFGFEIPLLAMHHNHAFARVAARSPEKIVLVPADSRWQSVFRTEHVDGGGLAVILAENRSIWADLRRKVVVDTGNSSRHFLPSEPVGEELRQRAEPVRFDRRRAEMQRP